MISWQASTNVLAGFGAALQLCETFSRRSLNSSIVFVDAASCELDSVAQLVDCVEASDERLIRVTPGADTVDNLSFYADRIRAAGTEGRVLAIGGGLVIDTSRLASLMASTEARRLPTLMNPGQSGLLMLAPKGLTTRPVTAFVTTLGTGAEVSPVACLHHSPAKRIVLGDVLKPEVAVLDPNLTASLPDHLVEQGIVEIILRFAGPYLAGPSQLALADTVALQELTALGTLLTRTRAGRLTSTDRLEVSLRSANTRVGWGLVGRAPCASKLWYLATALTDCAPIDKVPANLAMLPAVLGRITDGDQRFGQAQRIVDVDRALQPRPHRLTTSPRQSATNVADFLRQRHSNQPHPHADPGVVARHASRYWGSGQPMLGQLDESELIDLYSSVLSGNLVGASASGRQP